MTQSIAEAITTGDGDQVKQLIAGLAADVQVDWAAKDPDFGQCLLHALIELSHPPALSLALSRIAKSSDINSVLLALRDDAGSNCLHVACQTNNPEVIELIARACPGLVGAKDSKGCGPLHWGALQGISQASWTKLFEVTTPSVEEVNAQDANGWTALHYAASNNRPDSLLFLLQHGADKSVQSKAGATPKSLATERSFFKILDLLQ